MEDSSDNTIAAYCAYLGIATDRPAPDERTIRLLDVTCAHLARVPYENVSKWLAIGRGRAMLEHFDLARFAREMRDHGLGGTCFRLALACTDLLRGLGYDAALVTGPAGDHAATLVNLEDARLLVDVGFFAPFWQPIPLNRDTSWLGALGAFTVTPDGESVTLRRPSGTTRVLTLRPVSAASVWRLWVDSCDPAHPLFPRAVALQRLTADTAWSLFDHTLHTITAAGLEAQILAHGAARQVVRDTFGLDPDLWEEALTYRERLAPRMS